jgi:7-cyano-7-deazaguanine synthase
MPEHAVVLVSGGMDSATAAGEAAARGYALHFLHASYGQRTETREHECARGLAEHYDARFVGVETDHLARLGGSSLTGDGTIPDADPDAAGIPDTYVPFRNANLLAMAVSYAEANDCSAVFVGAHTGDFQGYPDCRPAFFDAFQRVIDEGTAPETEISVEAPFAAWSKADIVERGLDLDVPFEQTWSCYRREAPACGACDACVYRQRAFETAGATDPIEYAE